MDLSNRTFENLVNQDGQIENGQTLEDAAGFCSTLSPRSEKDADVDNSILGQLSQSIVTGAKELDLPQASNLGHQQNTEREILKNDSIDSAHGNEEIDLDSLTKKWCQLKKYMSNLDEESGRQRIVNKLTSKAINIASHKYLECYMNKKIAVEKNLQKDQEKRIENARKDFERALHEPVIDEVVFKMLYVKCIDELEKYYKGERELKFMEFHYSKVLAELLTEES